MHEEKLKNGGHCSRGWECERAQSAQGLVRTSLQSNHRPQHEGSQMEIKVSWSIMHERSFYSVHIDGPFHSQYNFSVFQNVRGRN